MKLTRWALAGASAYVIYKYTIGKKAKGEDVFTSPESDAEVVPVPIPIVTKPRRRKPE